MLSILQTELFQVCSCLGNLHAVEPGLQPELLDHLLHGGDARRTRHGARDSRADSSVRAGLIFTRAMAQAAVVPTAPSVQLPLGSDGRTVRAPTCYVHHVLPSLLS